MTQRGCLIYDKFIDKDPYYRCLSPPCLCFTPACLCPCARRTSRGGRGREAAPHTRLCDSLPRPAAVVCQASTRSLP